MPSVLKRGSLFQNETDPDAIKIDVLGDNKLCGSLIFSSEDLQMLVSRHVPRPDFSVSVFSHCAFCRISFVDRSLILTTLSF
jgi:hypothetical protein